MSADDLTDDQRDVCKCGKEIRWSSLQRKWFHLHNLMTFCAGMVKTEEQTNSPIAEPIKGK